MGKIFLTGSTGLLGTAFLSEITQHNVELLLGNRRTIPNCKYEQVRFDLERGYENVDLTGVEVVLHLATDILSKDTDLKGIRQLLKLVKEYDVKQLVYVSIVGVDKVPLRYFKTKYQVEQLIEANAMAYTILRSTQFFEFFEKEVQKQAKKKIAIIPNLKYQPIETRLVAKKLVQICMGNSVNSIIEIGGPEVLLFRATIKQYQALMSKKSLLISIPNFLLGELGSALTTQSRSSRSKTWQQYLNRR